MKGRMTVVDALRGVASLAVVLPHSAGFFASLDQSNWFIRFSLSFCGFGHFGVDIFFVLSGFVICYSIGETPIGLRFFLNFGMRRSIRLDPPYWAAIALMFGFVFLRSLATGRPEPYPAFSQTVAHVFYLQDILGLGNINAVFWTLCIEFQFYLVFCSSLGLVGYLARRRPRWRSQFYVIAFGGSACLSLASRSGLIGLHLPNGLFLNYWYEFMLGAFVWWYRANVISGLWAILFTAILIGAAFAGSLDGGGITALATACLIFWFSWRDKLTSALAFPVLQYFGKISYSLYLVHVPVVLLFMGIRTRVNLDSEILGFVLFAVAALASVFVAHLFYALIERPSAAWAKKLKIEPETNRTINANHSTSAQMRDPRELTVVPDKEIR